MVEQSKPTPKPLAPNEGQLYKAMEVIFLRNGMSFEVEKVVSVTQYTVLLKIKGQSQLMHVPKHSIDYTFLKPIAKKEGGAS